jgi:flagellar biosynthesis GTPase FlhF
MADDNAAKTAVATDDEWEYSSKPKEEDDEWEYHAAVNLPGGTPRLTEAVTSGKAPFIPPTKFEQERPGEGISLKGAGSAALEGIKGLGRGLVNLVDPTSGLSGAGLTAIGLNPRSGTVKERLSEVPIVGAAHEISSAYHDPNAKPWEVPIAGAGSLVGESAEKAREHAARGEGGAIIGEAAVPATVAALSPVVEPAIRGTGRMAGAFRESVGGAIHDPVTGEMTKPAEMISRAAGATVGGATGGGIGSLFGPHGGYIGSGTGITAGGIAGPALMERMFPEPIARTAARETFAKTKALTEANEGAIKENTARDNAAKAESERLQKAAEKAAQDAEDARNQHAQDLMNRQREQDALDRAEKRAHREAETARQQLERERQKELGANEKLKNQHAEDLMRRQKEQDALDKAAKKASDEAQAARDKHAEDLMKRGKEQDALDKEARRAAREAMANRPGIAKMTPPAVAGETNTLQGNATPFGNPQDLITRTKKLVRPGEAPSPEDLKRAGDMTQVPLSRLQLLAKWGDELAKNEINRRVRIEPDLSKAPLPRGEGQPAIPSWKPLIQPEAPASFRAGVERPEEVTPLQKPTKFHSEKAANVASKEATPEQLVEGFRTDKERLEKSRRSASEADKALIDQRLAEINQHLAELTGQKPLNKIRP